MKTNEKELEENQTITRLADAYEKLTSKSAAAAVNKPQIQPDYLSGINQHIEVENSKPTEVCADAFLFPSNTQTY